MGVDRAMQQEKPDDSLGARLIKIEVWRKRGGEVPT